MPLERMIRMKRIGQNIKKIRELKNFSRHYVASQLQISLTTYGKIERGELDLTVTRLARIAEIFGVTMTSIIDFDENKLLARAAKANR